MRKTVYHGGRFGKDRAWFSDNPKVAGGFGKITWDNWGIPEYNDYQSYEIEYNNPFIMDAKGENWLNIKTPKKLKPYWQSETIDSNGIVDICKKLGYDCIIIKNIEEGTTGAIGTDYCLLNGKYKNINESLNERLEKMGDCFITKSPYDIVNLFKNKPKEYRVLYDKNIDMYMIGDAESVTHYDMIQKAYKDAYYYNMEDFIQDLGGTIDNYTEMGQSGYWDGEDDENFDAYLWYIVFSPNEEWELGTDGYNKRYDYPFGHVFTRGCDLSEIGLWDALGVPQNSEKINESADNLNDAFWKWFGKSKLIENGKPMVFYHGTPNKFDTFDYEKSSFYSNLGQGFYFTPDENVAKEYLGGILNNKTSDSHIKKVYLRIENPLYADDSVTDTFLNLIIDCIKENIDDFWLKDIDMPYDEWYDEGFLPHLNKEDIITWKKYARKTKNHYNGEKNTYLSKGNNLIGTDLLYLFTDGYRNIRMKKHIQAVILKVYDGVIYDLDTEPKYVVFNPNQIKAIDNKGTWSTSSSNIYESLNRELERYL